MEINLGENHATGTYERYVSTGKSIRLVSVNKIYDVKYLYWQLGFQYIGFKNNNYYDSNIGTGAYFKHTERGYLLQGGIRISREYKYFNPYIAISTGIAYFNERLRWDNDNAFNDFYWDIFCNLFFPDSDCDITDYNSELLDNEWNFVNSVDLGFNLYPNMENNISFNIGVKYNMIPGYRKPDNIIVNSEDNSIVWASKKLQADYITYYLGISVPM
tara:strand:- start:110 stop:757 length:648 start_codon:yes stop_codon:yes gene_type:complete